MNEKGAQELIDSRTKEDLEREKQVLVKKFIKIQDKLEKYNEQSFTLSCEIEKINLMLKEREKGILNA